MLYLALVVSLLRFLPLLTRIAGRYDLKLEKYVLLGAIGVMIGILLWRAWVHLYSSLRKR